MNAPVLRSRRGSLVGLVVLALITLDSVVAQELRHEVTTINIEVPVRVFKGDTFVDNLTINDFEVFEDGKPQQIEAVYLVKKGGIQREEGNKSVRPTTHRTFIFLFEMREWLPELDRAMDYFFSKVILPGDALEIVTPLKPYKMRSDAMSLVPKDELKKQLLGKVKKDIIFSGSQLTNLLRELRTDAVTMNFVSYRDHLDQLEMLRKTDEQDLLAFARALKKLEGQKTVFLFYQREVLPQLTAKKFTEITSLTFDDPALQMDMANLLEFYYREPKFSVDAVKKAYSDSSMSIHFLFITKDRLHGIDINETGAPDGVIMVDKSEDIYSAFDEIAKATGGITESSFNIGAAFAKAADASENYYLLYYRPRDYKADGKFKEIRVAVKGGGYRVTHRAGYFAN